MLAAVRPGPTMLQFLLAVRGLGTEFPDPERGGGDLCGGHRLAQGSAPHPKQRC